MLSDALREGHVYEVDRQVSPFNTGEDCTLPGMSVASPQHLQFEAGGAELLVAMFYSQFISSSLHAFRAPELGLTQTPL